MAYSKFKDLKKVQNLFGIDIRRAPLFQTGQIKLTEPSWWLTESMRLAQMQGFGSEKERSERVISPILTELIALNEDQLTVYSGHELNVDKALGLNGECDYLLALGRKVVEMVQSPIFSVVEAKRQDMVWCAAQCAAQMVGAYRYNKIDGIETPYIYGATTDGIKWQFLKLEDNILTIHSDLALTSEMPILLGILQYILEDCKKFDVKTA